MNIDNVRELKQAAARTIIQSIEALPVASSHGQTGEPRRFISIGIAPAERQGDYRLAIRQQREDAHTALVTEQLRDLAKGEVDVRFIGRVRKAAVSPAQQTRNRPLLIGSSLGHYRGSAGTLGVFARTRGKPDSAIQLLSNNHVIARENRTRMHDPVLQPGRAHGGQVNFDRVAGVAKWIRLVTTPNTVDCAIAEKDEFVDYDPRIVPGLGIFSGGVASDVDIDTEVSKVGAASALTHGKVTTFELNDLVVRYGIGNLLFNGQIEVEGTNDQPFAQTGDSGSLVLDRDLLAVGLVFAVSTVGGSNGRGLTYVNPIKRVMDALDIDLVS